MNIKRILALLLVVLTALSLAACSEVMSGLEQAKDEIAAAVESEFKSAADGIKEAADSISTNAETESDEAAKPETKTAETTESAVVTTVAAQLDEDGSYTSKDDVALYIHTYGHLPSNFITKKKAESLGWSGGSLEPYAPGKCIGGGRFGNYEGILPEAPGRTYTECDIDTLGKKSRGAKRIVFSNDGLIYYTDDHYETFTLLYGGDD